MKKCMNCGYATESNINFCPMCGGKLAIQEPTPVQTEVPPAVNMVPVHPVCPPAPPRPKVSLAKKIVGMALSIAGFEYSLVVLIYGLYCSFLVGGIGLLVTLILVGFSIPLSAIGLSFSKAAIEAGDTSGFTRVGKIFGTLGMVLSFVTLGLSFLMTVSGLNLFSLVYELDPYGGNYYY